MTITCKCGHEVEVDYSPAEPAVIFAPPERCHPGDDADCEPRYCPSCDDDLLPLVEKDDASARDQAEIDRYEAKMEAMCREYDYD